MRSGEPSNRRSTTLKHPQEVEDNLLQHAAALPSQEAEQVLADYTTFLALVRQERVPLPDGQDVLRARPLIRHAADVPVLLSAM